MGGSWKVRLKSEIALGAGQPFDMNPDWGSTLGSVHKVALGSLLGCIWGSMPGCMLGPEHMAALGALLGFAQWCRLDWTLGSMLGVTL